MQQSVVINYADHIRGFRTGRGSGLARVFANLPQWTDDDVEKVVAERERMDEEHRKARHISRECLDTEFTI